ncbi:LysR family transcriptional regulator [Niallia sp. 03133]|uniref:LysR family transcriptional regulator n=1 Tax=Niallia sp. 03133 TaxID=3458060 RepID=UPI004043A29A
MELRHLKTFAIAAEHLNFTRAAEILNFTQPTVSSQIQALEQELGQSLFLRINKKLKLTPAGEMLQNHANEVLLTVQKIEREFAALSQPKGNLIIAAAEVYCTNYLLPITTEYIKNHPKVNIEILSRQTSKVIKGILNKEYDIGIIAGQFQDNTISSIHLEEEELLLVVSRELHEKYPLDRLLAELPFMRFRADGDFQDKMDIYMNMLPFKPNQTILVENEKAIKQGIIHQKGIGIMSSNYVKKDLEEGKLVALRLFEEKVMVKTSLIALEDNLQLNTFKTLCDMIHFAWDKAYELPSFS